VLDQFIETTEEIIEDMARLYETWHGQEDGRLRLDFNPHDLYFVTEKTMLIAQEKALEWGIGIHLHTAETEEEIDLFYKETGMRHVEWLADRELLGPYFQLAHSVWVTSDEIDQIAQSRAVVVHNPVSNMFLNDGVAPVSDMLDVGIPIAIGTDGQACHNGQEMIDTLKWVSNLHKINSQDARVFSPEQIIKMACRDGAAAFGQSIQIGSLDLGKKGDLVIIDQDDPRMTMPSLSIPSLLVNFARTEDVVTTIVDGKVLMRDREVLFVDEEQLKREFRDARTSLLERIGIF
jgi:5-methylthioadenosine/S-adenosylhomocysteine deaminase